MKTKQTKKSKKHRILPILVVSLALLAGIAFLLIPATSAWTYYYPNYDNSSGGPYSIPYTYYHWGQLDGDLYAYVTVAHGGQAIGVTPWVSEDDIYPTQTNELKIKIYYYRGFFAKSEGLFGFCTIRATAFLMRHEGGISWTTVWSGHLFNFQVNGPGQMSSNQNLIKTFNTGHTVDSTKRYAIHVEFTAYVKAPLIGVSYIQRTSTSTNPALVSVNYIAIDYY